MFFEFIPVLLLSSCVGLPAPLASIAARSVTVCSSVKTPDNGLNTEFSSSVALYVAATIPIRATITIAIMIFYPLFSPHFLFLFYYYDFLFNIFKYVVIIIF